MKCRLKISASRRGLKAGSQIPGHPVLAAETNVLVVGSQHHLSALLEDLAMLVEAGVEGGLLAAPADGLDLLDLDRKSVV